MPDFLKSAPVRVVSLLLILQGAFLYSSVRHEVVPPSPPLADLPKSLGNWQFTQEGIIDQESRDILRADDLMSRAYVDPSTRRGATLFVAAFRSQSNGKVVHSPKNCLPGSGWTSLKQDDYRVDVGEAAPITVNRYVVQHEKDYELVLYWYQSRDRVVANEYAAKYYVMVDAIRLNRTDTALVRVIVPMAEDGEEAATRTAADFVRALFKPLHHYLPA